MIDEIHNGNFSPDNQRSKFFPKGAVAVETTSRDGPALDPPGFNDSQLPVDAVVKVEPSEPETDAELHAVPAHGDDAPVSELGESGEIIESSDSSSSSDESSSSESDGNEAQRKVKRFRARIPRDESWYVHRRSHLIHRFEPGDQFFGDTKFLVCGKQLTDAYSLCTEASAWNSLCKSCNRK